MQTTFWGFHISSVGIGFLSWSSLPDAFKVRFGIAYCGFESLASCFKHFELFLYSRLLGFEADAQTFPQFIHWAGRADERQHSLNAFGRTSVVEIVESREKVTLSDLQIEQLCGQSLDTVLSALHLITFNQAGRLRDKFRDLALNAWAALRGLGKAICPKHDGQ
jgi:hypothetical protein